MAFGKKEPKKKQTKGFSELNKRTYEASEEGQRHVSTSAGRNNPGFNSNQTNSTFNKYSRNNVGQNYGVSNRTNARQPNQPAYAGGQPQNVNLTSRAQNSQREYRGAQGRSAASFGSSQNAADYSRANFGNRYHEQVNKAKKKKKRKIIIIVIAAIIAALIGAGIAYATGIFSNMNAGMGNIGLTPTKYSNEPFYMVLMGTDSSAEREAEGGGDDGVARSDSLILARIDPVNKLVSLISIPRDTQVDMGEYGIQKINAAHSLGGPELVVKSVSKLAGVPITHYAEINFDGFQSVVDLLGGVEVSVPMRLYDELSGVNLQAGDQVLNGEQALALARTRHAYDEYGSGDKLRSANQRMLLSAIAKKALQSDILTIASTATKVSEYVKTDMALNDIIGLAQLMKDIDPASQVYTAQMPTTSQYINGVWYEIVDQTEWKKMMDRMEQGLPPSSETVVDRATGAIISNSGNTDELNKAHYTGTVSVRNGTTTEGKAASVSTKLYDVGFTTNVANANQKNFANTVIVYTNDSQKATADAIREILGCGEVVKNNNEYLFSTDYLVVVGADYNG